MSYLDDGALSRLSAFTAGEGAVLGDRFELSAPIGEGGMGVVWSAWDREAEREVAVKVLRDTRPDLRDRFAREIAAMERLDHAAIPRPIAHGVSDGGAPWLVMERLTGRTLADHLVAGRLSVRDAVELGLGVARALVAVHAAGLVHRDLKPSNVFLVGGAPRDIRLLDFGLSRDREGPRVTRTGALLGTPGYMAPEQVRGEARLGEAADVFPLGALLFECLAGRPAFAAEDEERLHTQILLEDPPRLRSIRSEVPPALDDLVASMLAKDPAARPRATEIASALDRVLAALGDDGEASSLPAVGSLVSGKYRVEGTLGEGGMGVILAATHVELGRQVALKLLRARRGREDEARLYREARALSRLESEHAARVLDVGRLDDGAPYVVIERLEGQDLGRVLRERGPLPIADVARWVGEACEAIGEAHAIGIIHRDLKPSNLFLTRRRDGSECIKVLDFGISKVVGDGDHDRDRDHDRTLTAPSTVLGSPWYMSPEQLTGERPVDARADVWALGVVLHELVTGAPPFDAATAAGVGARIAAGAPVKLRDARPEAPAALEAVVLRCLEKDPDRRFANVDELARALAAFAENGRRETIATAVVAEKNRDFSGGRRKSSARTIVAVAVAGFIFGGVGLVMRERAPHPVQLAPVPTVTQVAPVPPPPSFSASVAPPSEPQATATQAPSAAPPPARSAEPKPISRAVRPTVSAAPRPVKTAEPKPPPTIDVRDPALDGR